MDAALECEKEAIGQCQQQLREFGQALGQQLDTNDGGTGMGRKGMGWAEQLWQRKVTPNLLPLSHQIKRHTVDWSATTR